MSYSTYMRIYNWTEADINEAAESACKKYKAYFPEMPDIEYWDTSNKDYRPFADFMKSQISKEIRFKEEEESSRDMFIFCNHDGQTDEEVFQGFIDFGKLLAWEDSELLIQITSNIREDKMYFIHKELGVGIIENKNTKEEEYRKLMEYIDAKTDIVEKQTEIKTAEDTIKEYEKTIEKH